MAKMVLVLAAIMMVMNGGVAAEDYAVGDDDGWTRPPSTEFYSVWATKHTFAVGDTLVFNYRTGHTVAMVPREGFGECTAANAKVHSDSPTKINLNQTGSFYFICTTPGHCDNGQRLALNVTSFIDSPGPPSDTFPSPPSDETRSSSSPATYAFD